MSDPDPDIIYSDLCRTVTLDGITVELKIYRVEHDPRWALEVVNETGTSTVWDDLFETDTDASEAFLATVQEEGMETFLDDEDDEGHGQTLH
jgi:hypothetical protein|nr:hypothetical protein [uncultured organism]